MATKIHGVRTGTIDGFTESGERVKWVPTSELTLVTSDDVVENEFVLPRRIAANPSARQGFREFISGDKPPVKDTARLFVGFNVGDEEFWRAGQVYLMGYLLRETQLRSSKKIAPAFSFYVGLGAFPGDKVVSSERSAQFVFMNFAQPHKKFFSDMFELAAEMAEWLHQESVLLEAQGDGKVIYLDYIESDPKKLVDTRAAEDYLEENKHRVKPSVWRAK